MEEHSFTMKEIKELEDRLAEYKNLIKQQNTDMYFVESQIIILEAAVTELKNKLIKSGDRTDGGLYEYTLQAVVTDVEAQVSAIMKRIKEK